MSLRRSWALVLAVFATSVGALASASPSVAETSACGAGAYGSSGYAYAGHQANSISAGIGATITALRTPSVAAGHVAGWIGVGGPGQGPNGETMWLQTGIAALPGTPPMLYVEITRSGREPTFVTVLEDVKLRESHDLAVLEIRGRPGVWRVWLDGRPATDPIVLPGSHERWKPIATAESWNGNARTCNTFGFQFERVRVAGPGGSWRAFNPGFTFLDRGYSVRQLRPVGERQRTLASDAIQPFAFVAQRL
ncbi:MAG: hypothetical protein ACR2HI_01590 [Gaiella sp.]